MNVDEHEIDDDSDSEEEREKEADFFQAIRKGKLHEVQAFLKSGMNINIIDRNNRNNTPLHVAVEKCNREIVEEFLLRDCKTNINAQNSNGDTPLHIAVSKGQNELVKLLLNEHADTSIRNNKLKTPSELTKNQGIIDILAASAQPQAQTSGAHASNQRMLPMKRKESDEDDSPTKRPRISLGIRRPNDEESGCDNDQTKKLKTSEEYQASGLKSSLHGVAYQLKLLMLCLKRGVDQGYSFRLATEMDAAEKFDDLVFQYRQGNKIVHRFLQAKHKQNQSENISVHDLLKEKDGNFSLQKYFISYRNIKRKLNCNSINNDIGDLIICTNIGFKSGDKWGSLTLSYDIFDKRNDGSIFKTELHRFKKNIVGRKEIVSVLENASDLVKLAKKLAECVLDGGSIDCIESQNDTSGNLFRSYQFALADEVIDTENKKLHTKFLMNDVNLSLEAKNLRKAFEKYGYHDRKTFIKDEDLDIVVQEFVALIVKNQSSKKIEVAKSTNKAFKKYLDESAGYVLLKENGVICFSTNFLDNRNLPRKLDSFREHFWEKLSRENLSFTTLADYEFVDYEGFQTYEKTNTDTNGFWEGIKTKTLELFDHFGKPVNVKLKELKKFVDSFHNLILKSTLQNEDSVKIRFSKNIKILSEHVFVEENGRMRFSNAFLGGTTLPGNLNDFRNELKNRINSSVRDKVRYLGRLRFVITHYPQRNVPEDAELEGVDTFVNNFYRQIQESASNEEETIRIKRETTTFSNNLDKLAKHALMEENGTVHFSREFLVNNQLPDDLNEFKQKLMDKISSSVIDKVEYLVELRFVINNFPKYNLPNDSIIDIYTDIQTFLNKLVFAVDQPNEIELDKTIIAEMGECKDINVIDSEFLASNFEKYILDWMKEKKGRFLTCIDGKKFFDEMKMKLVSLKLTGLTLEYRSKMEQTNIRFANDEIELKQFLEPGNRVQLFILQSMPDTILGLIKVYQTIENIPEYKNGNGYIFIRLHSFLRMRDFVADAFGSQKKHLLIINCKSVQKSERDFDRERELIEVIKFNDTWKIILITDNDNMLSKILKLMYSDRYVEKKIEVNSLLDLDRESRSKIMKEREVMFQGQEIPLSDLINEESMSLIDAAALTKLINNTTLKIAEPLQDLGDVSAYYIPRTLKRWEKINRGFEHDKSRFYVPPNGRFDDFNFIQNQDIVLISDNNTFFKELRNEKEYEKYNIHWLKLKNGEYKWQASNGALSKMRELVDERKESATTYTPTKVNDIMNKVVIIAAEPGMGKSTVLTNLALETKAAEPTLWVARINLSVDSSKELYRRVDEKIRFDEKEATDFFLKTMKLKPGLEQELFKYSYERGRLVLLFDGFDEISPDYTDKVIELLNFLKGTKVDKIWVTTRPYNIKNDLEDELGLFSHVLEEFSKDDQRRFLKKFWTANAQLDNFDESRAEMFIDKLLDSFSKLINDQDRKFISIPLQIRMVAEVWKKTFAEFCESTNHELSIDQKRMIEEKLDLIGLYQKFFKTKFDDICFREKKPEWNEVDVETKRIQNEERERVVNNHKELALLNLCSGSQVDQLIPDVEKHKLLENVRQSVNKTGIIDRVVDDKPVFVHQSFAEYFAALWLTEKLYDKKKMNIVIAFLMEHIFQDENKVIRNFFDRILTKDNKNNEKYKIHNAVLNYDLHEFERLLDIDASLLNTRDKAGRTPLHLAAAYGHVEITRSLLRAAIKCGYPSIVSMKDELFDWSSLSYADKNNHWSIVELLLQNGANGEDMFQVHEKESMLLYLAAKHGHLEIVKYITGERKANFDIFDETGKTPLNYATLGGHLDIIKYFVNEKNANVNAVNARGKTSLHYATMVEHLNIIKYLVGEKNAIFDALDERGNTPLHYAVYQGNLEIIKYLVDEKKADSDAVNAEGKMPLHYAIQRSHLDIIKYLVDEKNADFEAFDAYLKAPLHYAVQQGNLDIVKYLVNEKNADCNTFDEEANTPLYYAVYQGNLEIIKYLVNEKNAQFDTANLGGNTPLHYATRLGNLEITKYLVDEKNADFNAVDIKGRTPLHHATQWSYLDIIKYLVNEENVSSSAVNAKGNALLPQAAPTHNLDMIKNLVDEKNANSDALDAEENTPLYYATTQEHLDIVKYLVYEKNANFDVLDAEGNMPLHYGTMEEHLDIIKYLVDKKNAHFDVLDSKKNTPLHYAAQRGHMEIVKYLVDVKSASYDVPNTEGSTLLHYAAQGGHIKIIKYLVNEKDANFDAINAQGNTPLHYAARRGHIEIIKYLVDEKNAKFDIANAEGNTLLHYAARGGHMKIIKYLVDEKNANPDVVNAEGNIPMYYLIERDDAKMRFTKFLEWIRTMNTLRWNYHTRAALKQKKLPTKT